MQKDIHFYLTYALCMKVGIQLTDAEKIAWADQYTDDLTKADLHGIQTQSSELGNWNQRQIQLSVLVPFHFLPGDDSDHPWMTTRDCLRARHLVELASANLLQLGIAFHAYQDTFSHETFSGWREDLNACFPWYNIEAAIPNVGHAEMRVIPDVVNYVWTDPRSQMKVDNKERAMKATKGTFDYLAMFFNPGIGPTAWQGLESDLKRIFEIESYDKRIDELCVLSGNATIDYKEVSPRLEQSLRRDFVQAASNHLAEAMKLFRDLPWVAMSD